MKTLLFILSLTSFSLFAQHKLSSPFKKITTVTININAETGKTEKGATTTLTYSPSGNVLTRSVANSNFSKDYTTIYQYNKNDKPIGFITTYSDGKKGSFSVLKYDKDNVLVLKKLKEKGKTSTFHYQNGKLQRLVIEDNDGVKNDESYFYNSKGLLIKSENMRSYKDNPEGNFTLISYYDEKERITKLETDGFVRETYSYNDNYNDDGSYSITKETDGKTTTVYSKDGTELYKEESYDGAINRSWTYTYNDKNLLIELLAYDTYDGSDNAVFKYDAFGNQTLKKTTSDSGEYDSETYTSYTYDEYNNWTSKKTLSTDYEEIIERKIEYYK